MRLSSERPGAPRQIGGDDQVERALRLTLEEAPKGATHWSSRALATRTGLSQSTVSRIWRAFGLRPHRSEAFQLSNHPLLVDQVRAIVGLYMNPPHHAIVLGVDEKSQIQALSRSQPLLPMLPGQAEPRTHDYQRHGTTSLFAALEIATGSVIGKCWPRPRALEFRKFLQHIDRALPADLAVHLVLDNYATHKTQEIRQWFLRHPRYTLHFTPTHSSWLEPSGALVRSAITTSDQARFPLQCARTGSCHRRVHRHSQPATQALCMDQKRR